MLLDTVGSCTISSHLPVGDGSYIHITTLIFPWTGDWTGWWSVFGVRLYQNYYQDFTDLVNFVKSVNVLVFSREVCEALLGLTAHGGVTSRRLEECWRMVSSWAIRGAETCQVTVDPRAALCGSRH